LLARACLLGYFRPACLDDGDEWTQTGEIEIC
jgi:hypothetical protein